VPGLQLDFGGSASNDNVMVQHTVRASKVMRVVWGAELRRESIVSRPQYDTDAAFVTDFSRLFGNAEWRLRRDLVLNAGAMFERSSIAGDTVSPRAMLNWHVAEGQTLRYGVSRAYRPPSTFEKYANVRYYDPVSGTLLGVNQVALGNVDNEDVLSREIGYLGEFPRWGLSVDVRGFEEEIRGLIKPDVYSAPLGVGCPPTDFRYPCAVDYVNKENFKIRGYEYQLKWVPWRSGQLIYSQSLVDSTQSVGSGPVQAFGSQGLMFMQRLAGGLDFSLIYYEADASHFPAADERAPSFSRTDVRLAKAMRLGGKRAELSFVVQNLGASYQDFMPGFRFYQQAYVMLRLEN
jgi:iron complex outermembrane receptor protein